MSRMTVADLLACKGKRKLTKVTLQDVVLARAAEAAGIEVATARLAPGIDQIRAAAPSLFLVFGLRHGESHSKKAELARAFDAMERGADAVYCPMRKKVVRRLADEGVPVVGHVGLIPRRATWTGGMKPVGKTVAQAEKVWDAVRRYEDAGAIAVEMELVPERVATEIARRTSMIVFSMGSGGGCDGDFLFTSDITGETEGRIPRHARVYADLAAEQARLHRMRVAALRAFREECDSGAFPSARETVAIEDEEFAAFLDRLDRPAS
ncbi:3-methyl-2-oxobutanoate hydroxymethyltransferase [Fluviibacterium sp. DFM31]|uniref:3-methyl-2-oxobutanoate hydroxymethyltransferase n=1 Tax=Meridianimarinicoccus marinus TaxID=3231483 RepID=A0ABV3L9N5_9RHOB